MADKSKQKYYQKNKKERLKYQREYYKRNAEKIRRKRELKKEDDPSWAEAQRNYNRQYYINNKKKIKAKRAATRIARLLRKPN